MGNTPIEIEITGWTISTEELLPLASTIELAAAGCVETLKLGSRRLPLKLGCKAAVETKVAQRPRPRNITHREPPSVQNSSFNISQTVAKC